jgi:hypothetical protein
MVSTTEIGGDSDAPREQVRGARIDINAEGDLAYWIKVFDTTHVELLGAIAAVGDDAASVGSYLKRGSRSEPTPVPQIPDGG